MTSRHPPTPETWALAMLAVLGVLAAVTFVFFFLGAIPTTQLWLILGMLVFGAFSVGMRYIGNAGPPSD